jgi:hypothetical protein
MEAVAKFYASRKKNDTPNHRVAKSILFLAANTLGVLLQDGASLEKVLGTMEKAGLLRQLIRCVPVDPEYSAPSELFANMLASSQEKAQVGYYNGRHSRCCDCRKRWAHQRGSQVCPLHVTEFSSTLQQQRQLRL